MATTYQDSVTGLSSEDPAVILESSVWLIEHPDQIEDQDSYLQACDFLQTASLENVECLQYINENLVGELGFKAQLLSAILKESTTAPEIKSEAHTALCKLIDSIAPTKASNTELIAQIYSAIEDSGNTEVLEHAKKLL